MQTPYINEMLHLPELLVLLRILSIDADELHIEASPVLYKQDCPICHLDVCVTLSVILMSKVR